MTYDEFPIKDFCRILSGIKSPKDCGVADEDWTKIREEYSILNPTPQATAEANAVSKVLSQTFNLQKLSLILGVAESGRGDLGEFFKAGRLKWSDDDMDKNYKLLTVELSKATQKHKIYEAQLNKIRENAPQQEEQSNEEIIKKINKSLALMDLQGATITDPEKFTCGQYDATNLVLRERTKDNG